MTKKKATKKRASKYEKKLKINATFDEAMKVLVSTDKPIKEASKKK